ncbi:MAG: histidine phosphatase family protein [Candidatus Riflebacteria bacterium]|nr:histidine phosphatase family protein [Candidatus Riflebacteria bacterium]
MIICLIRHGETVFNREERLQGARDIELSARGLDEAVALGHRLRAAGLHPRRIYTSPVKRAHDTAHHLGYPVPVVPRPAFRARGLGELEGLTKTEIRGRYPGAIERLIHWDWPPPGGEETLRDMFHRADAGVAEVAREEAAAGLGVIVTHSGVLEALGRGWLRLEPHQRLPFPMRNAGAILFSRIDGQWQPGQVIAAGGDGFVDHA